MERRLTTRIRNHEKNFKNDIQKWFSENNCSVVDSGGLSKTSEFLKHVYDAEPLSLSPSDFTKRKRVKNDAPFCERCSAKRADGQQCTRRKRNDNNYCGTHMKGTPHGVIETNGILESVVKKITLTVVDINGIHYHVDTEGNVYDATDIISGSSSPSIIAQYNLSESGEYSLVS